MDIWTQEDERQLLALQVRRKVTHERNFERLMELVKRVVPVRQGTVSDVSIYDLRAAMIEHGGAFRDALEPFDHMGRPQPAHPLDNP